MPKKQTLQRAAQKKRTGVAPSTQVGKFVREEIHHIRQGKHGARTTKQAIAIGLSKARRAGVPLRPPGKGRFSTSVREKALHDYRAGQKGFARIPTRTRSQETKRAHKKGGKGTASRKSLSRHAREGIFKRSIKDLRRAARDAILTTGEEVLRRAAQKTAHARARRRRDKK